MKTEEQILAEIEIHKKTNATAKVALLEERLNLLRNGPVKNTEEKVKAEAPIEENETVSPPKEVASAEVSPIQKIEKDHEAEIDQKRDEMAAELEKMKQSGLSWPEITESTGVKAPWMVIKSWKKRQSKSQ